MAGLTFKGKAFVQNHHLAVPFHELVPVKAKGLSRKPSLDDNLIVHGDNLKALKALLPSYAGKVKCIYIDPPYNTGTENWVYNDNVNSPMIQEWLGKVVDRDDLTRHEKWLCMMTPRLKLLREFLSKEGLIFVSIDENEGYHLRLLMDEIFGERNFVANLIWKSKSGGAGDAEGIAVDHEYILVYSKSPESRVFYQDKDAVVTTSYNQVEADGRRYALDRLDKQSLGYLESLDFPIKGPDGKKYVVEHKDPKSKVARWRWSEETVEERYDELVFKWPYVYTKN